MKRALLVCSLLTLAMTGCGKKEEQAKVSVPQKAEVPAEIKGEIQKESKEASLPEVAPGTAGAPAKDKGLEHEAAGSQGKAVLTHDEALVLAKGSGCMVCHSIERKLVGPAWKDVAAKYKGDNAARARMIEVVKKGGRGNWTDVTGGASMPPYSPRVTDENIEKLVDFILSL